ncbi:N-terminal kinase-like protein [Halyomorpha halys]|uniref:N-terminal kinase-like protein n=1 Tax=Halyomorpha halys TaxID=286706 RepID=UPI0006D4DF4D|nr:N-terminal kinase-like protein [Halyomorpha halys]
MLNFFSIRDSFPYTFEEEIVSFRGYSVFSVSNGIKKATGDKVSIFTYNKKIDNREDLLNHAKIAVKILKKFKHPSILTYVDSYEDENYIYLVTNHCLPLFAYLHKLGSADLGEMYLKWGLASIGEAVAFLNSVDLRHNNIFHGSVFVNDQGTWQLGDLGYVTDFRSEFPPKQIKMLDKYCPPEKDSLSDDWGIGVLLWETFNGEIESCDSLKDAVDIPDELHPVFQLLTSNNQSCQETITNFIDVCREDNMLTKILEGLNSYHLKDRDGKSKLSRDMIKVVTKIPKDIIVYRILIQIRQAYEHEEENGSYLVPVVSKIASILNEDEFRSHLEPFVAFLFSTKDRATRFTLLTNINEIANKIDNKSINNLYPIISAGFLDTTPQIRDETVKAMMYVAPKLSKTVIREMIRHLVHIQKNDENTYLRTNATICMANIAYCLEPRTRQKVLLYSFLLALNDPDHYVRRAAVHALNVTHRFFTVDAIAKNVLPQLVSLTVDKEPYVRQIVFKTLKIMLLKLEEVSYFPQRQVELEKDVTSVTCDNTPSWAQWALTAFTKGYFKNMDNTDPMIPEKIAIEDNIKPVCRKENISPDFLTIADMTPSELGMEDHTNNQICPMVGSTFINVSLKRSQTEGIPRKRTSSIKSDHIFDRD